MELFVIALLIHPHGRRPPSMCLLWGRCARRASAVSSPRWRPSAVCSPTRPSRCGRRRRTCVRSSARCSRRVAACARARHGSRVYTPRGEHFTTVFCEERTLYCHLVRAEQALLWSLLRVESEHFIGIVFGLPVSFCCLHVHPCSRTCSSVCSFPFPPFPHHSLPPSFPRTHTLSLSLFLPLILTDARTHTLSQRRRGDGCVPP